MRSAAYVAIENWLTRQKAAALPLPSAAADTMSVRFSMGDVEVVVSGSGGRTERDHRQRSATHVGPESLRRHMHQKAYSELEPLATIDGPLSGSDPPHASRGNGAREGSFGI